MAFAVFPGSRRRASICQVGKYATCASPAMERFGSVQTRVLQAGKMASLPIIRNSIPASRAYAAADGQRSWLAEKFAKFSGKDTG